MTKNEGGPAFPQALQVQEEFIGSEGMSLRDYFAGQAMASQIIGPNWSVDADFLARQAYIVADAMLTERAKT